MIADYVRAAEALEAPVIVAHSNAGNFVPSIVAAVTVRSSIFMDAVLPPFDGRRWEVAPAALAELLRDQGDESLLPAWTRWWPASDMSPVFASTEQFDQIDRAAPEIPRSYLTETLTASAGWADSCPGGYLQFADTYQEEASRASRHGWPVRRLEYGHLGMLTHPKQAADAILALAD